MKKFLILAFIIMVGLSACTSSTSATETLAPANAPTEVAVQATEPPAPTPTELPLDYFTQDFNTTLANWTNWYFVGGGSAVTTNIDPAVTIEVSDGFLVFDVTQENTGGLPVYDGHEYTDVRIDAKIKNDGRRSNYSTLMCRFSEKGWYEFNINNGGEWWINVATIDNSGNISWDYGINSGGNTTITTDINEIGFSCVGDLLTGYINGQELKGIKDSRLVSGKVGLQAGAGNVVPVLISFDWVKVSQP